MASPERLSTASSHSTPAATRFTLSTGEYSSCTHTHIGACTAASQQEGPGFDSRMGRCWYWGQVLLQCSGGLGISRYLCLEFACSPSVHKNPHSTLSYQSLTKMDGSLHLVPGRLKAALVSSRKDNPGWGNAEVKFTAIVDITSLYT